MRPFIKYFIFAFTCIFIASCEASNTKDDLTSPIELQIKLTSAEARERDAYVQEKFDNEWPYFEARLIPIGEALLQPNDLETLKQITRERFELEWLEKTETLEFGSDQKRKIEFKEYELLDRSHEILEPVIGPMLKASLQKPFDREAVFGNMQDWLKTKYESKYYNFTEAELIGLVDMQVEIQFLQPQFRRAYRLENIETYESAEALVKKRDNLARRFRLFEQEIYQRPRRTDKNDIREGKLDVPELGTFDRKILSYAQKRQMRKKRLAELTALTKKTGLVLPETKIDRYVELGEVIHDIRQDRKEATYQMQYHRYDDEAVYRQKSQDASKRLNAALDEQRAIKNPLKLASSKLELADIETRKSEILREKEAYLRRVLEQRLYSYTEEDVTRLAALGFEIDIAQQKYDIAGFDPNQNAQTMKAVKKELEKKRAQLLAQIELRPLRQK